MSTQVITSEYLASSLPSKQLNTHLIILNWTLPSCLISLWPNASVRICADGGANRLYDELPALLPQETPDAVRRRFVPDVIHGDLDSLRSDVRQFYLNQGVKVAHSPDQDTTDLTKCVQYIEQHHSQTLLGPSQQSQQAELLIPDATDSSPLVQDGTVEGNGAATEWDVQESQQGVILALGALGGRLDHTLANINTLHMFRHLPVALLGEGNLVRLVRAGRCLIKPCRDLEGPICGLVPISGPARVTMRGFKWDLTNDVMQMGGLVSTSNEIASPELLVESDQDLIWTTQLQGCM